MFTTAYSVLEVRVGTLQILLEHMPAVYGMSRQRLDQSHTIAEQMQRHAHYLA